MLIESYTLEDRPEQSDSHNGLELFDTTESTTLTDSYKRRFTYLRLSITDVCNFRCNYCLPDGYCHEGDKAHLSLDEIRTVAAAFAKAGTRKIRITGGEPTLRKDLPEIIRICKQTPGIEKVALTTNGYKLTKQIDELLDCGLDALNISMDSLRPETFQLITGHDKLDEIKQAMAMAFERGFTNIKINAVLMKEYNLGELQAFLDFVRDTPISLRFIEVMQTGDNQQFFNAQHVSGEVIQEQLIAQGWQPVMRDADAGPAKEFTHPDHQGRIGLIMPYSKNFCASCNRLRVASNGKLHLCLFGDSNIDLRPLLGQRDSDQLAAYLHQAVAGKKESHLLHDQETGLTRNLAMLGG
ncbi:MAG: GTP 3',8-cyclase MoaA [Candidatus Pelagadaptatus aseana]|uniref:GTP 3',8-cyclase MoaA n=1 Tax=Candidatus Pelagadaptatus aseana TaxID=3120508 RepID=UPI0039B26CED